ncbi:uncharacterized protein Z520_04348 [Fonsecaea multimorphosa CBS 102226]|uniref:Uncharacterized protein n=1 Tax=Fonsecaea multimorphosa CBS 102226 TaxID=1442371 RepID=A0A0D2K1H8_9EURO|nr:uncharacterized protein Z520_04348 [Fonsecaea multimorphosa CBS 102226]KIX99712.1 hypothetical protein Z520_04348 [Fonsecaea multimorphosa CBS 102226]OAL26760.1 hypothetical protein AYO22_04113 [Fonsecaea multimorphosa]
MSSGSEMQHLLPDVASRRSSRTFVADQNDSKSEQLLQLILEELESHNKPQMPPEVPRNETRDFASVQSKIARATTSSSADSLMSPTGSPEDKFYEKLFGGVVAFAAFGGSITFQCIFQAVPDTTENPEVTPEHARTFIAISWLLFTMDLSLASVLLAAMYVHKAWHRRHQLEPETQWTRFRFDVFRYVNLIAALVLPLGSLIALMFTALAVSVFSSNVGWAALVSVIVLAGAIAILWVGFCVREYRTRHSRKRRGQDSAA